MYSEIRFYNLIEKNTSTEKHYSTVFTDLQTTYFSSRSEV